LDAKTPPAGMNSKSPANGLLKKFPEWGKKSRPGISSLLNLPISKLK
jgi:hypothetical protein